MTEPTRSRSVRAVASVTAASTFLVSAVTSPAAVGRRPPRTVEWAASSDCAASVKRGGASITGSQEFSPTRLLEVRTP